MIRRHKFLASVVFGLIAYVVFTAGDQCHAAAGSPFRPYPTIERAGVVRPGEVLELRGPAGAPEPLLVTFLVDEREVLLGVNPEQPCAAAGRRRGVAIVVDACNGRERIYAAARRGRHRVRVEWTYRPGAYATWTDGAVGRMAAAAAAGAPRPLLTATHPFAR